MKLSYQFQALDKLKDSISKLLKTYDRQIVYLVSLVSVTGSLAVSEIFGWATFPLSVVQRIFMYPILIISGLSIVLDSRKVLTSVLLLSIPGVFASLAHFVNIVNRTLIGCGFALPCSTSSRIIIFNYTVRPIDLPSLALTAFILITAVITFNDQNRKLIIKELDEKSKYGENQLKNIRKNF